MSLDARLLAAAAYVVSGSRVADIGTDHAYLPIHLIKQGIADYVYACDIREKPLKNAADNIALSGVSGIETRLGNGLSPIKPHEVDTIIIAGMGGEVISGILKESHWVKNSKYNIILQPMSSVYELRRYLCDNGFTILTETAVRSSGRLYTLLKVKFTNSTEIYDDFFCYFGKLFESVTPENTDYIEWTIKILSKQIAEISGIERMAEKHASLTGIVTAAQEHLKKQQG